MTVERVSFQPAADAAPGAVVRARDGEEKVGRTVIVSAPVNDGSVQDGLGTEAYSYYFVYRAFKGMLERWGRVVEVKKAESQVNFAFLKAKKRGEEAFHLAFFPPHLMYLSSVGPTVGIVAWEFSTIPDCGFGKSERHNWVRVLNQLKMVITLSEFSRRVLVESGVKTPVVVISPPVARGHFGVAAWSPGVVEIDCPAYELTAPGDTVVGRSGPAAGVSEAARGEQRLRRMYSRGKRFYYAVCHSWMPPVLNKAALGMAHAMKERVKKAEPAQSIGGVPQGKLKLSGVVYTTILSVFDARKNWRDIVTAFLMAFMNTPEATLVLKIVAPAHLREESLGGVAAFCRSLGIQYQCRVVATAAYLTNEQMEELMQGSTFYVNASRAEGLCIPLLDYLAAGRPAVAPRHTAMLDFFDENVGFVVNSNMEPTHWPHDPREHLTTTWQRINWESLRDQLLKSYETATRQPEVYRKLSAEARRRMHEYAGVDNVEPKLRAALGTLIEMGAAKPGQ